MIIADAARRQGDRYDELDLDETGSGTESVAGR